MGPGTRRRGSAGNRRRHRRLRDPRHPRLQSLDDLRQHRRAQQGGDRLLHATRNGGARRRRGRRGGRVVAIEGYGVEPVPRELRVVGWRDLFAINFTFFLNPVMYVLGALAVAQGGLPLWLAVAAMVLGQARAFACLVPIAPAGVDYGLPAHVSMRATLVFWAARILSSLY